MVTWLIRGSRDGPLMKICPHCSMEEETINHFIGQCPMWFNRRGRFFNCYYTSVSEIADHFPLRKIVGYICSTNRFNQQWLVKTKKWSYQSLTKFWRNTWLGRAKGRSGLISQRHSRSASSLYEEEEEEKMAPEFRKYQIRIPRKILCRNSGLTFVLAQKLKKRFFSRDLFKGSRDGPWASKISNSDSSWNFGSE